MSRKCLFCDNDARSREHVWPQWVLDKLPPQKITGFIGSHKNIVFNREWKTRCVCKSCNEGWMSDLETEASRIMGALIDDHSRFFSADDQVLISTWACKTAMVVDSVTAGKKRFLFFRDNERLDMRFHRAIPRGTTVWVGRYLSSGLGADSGACYYRLPDCLHAYTGFLSTVVMGSLAVQTLTMRAPAEYRYRAISLTPAPGPWNEIVSVIWPIKNASVYWPPILGFDDSVFSTIKGLHARWRLGTEFTVFD